MGSEQGLTTPASTSQHGKTSGVATAGRSLYLGLSLTSKPLVGSSPQKVGYEPVSCVVRHQTTLGQYSFTCWTVPNLIWSFERILSAHRFSKGEGDLIQTRTFSSLRHHITCTRRELTYEKNYLKHFSPLFVH